MLLCFILISTTSCDPQTCLFVAVLLVADISDDGLRCLQLFGIHIWDLEAELVFHSHDDFDVIEGVESEVFREVRVYGELLRVHFVVQTQDEDDTFLDQLQCQRFLGGVMANW